MSDARERGVVAAASRWFFLTGDRRAVAAVLLVGGYILVGPVGHAVLPGANHFTDQQTTLPLINTMLAGTFFLFSIVISVNSLFVSGEQNPLDQQFGRIQSVVEFRRQLEQVVEADHVPADPVRLIRLVSGDILRRAQELEDELATSDVDVRENVGSYVESLAAETGEMNDELRDASSTLAVTIATMDYNHDRQINDLRRLRADHSDALSERADQRIDELLRLLQYFAAARQYFKTLYTRTEFADLSMRLVLVSLPAVAITASFLHYLSRLPENHLLITGVEAVAFAPFLLVASYVVRVATVSRRTQAAGQFAVTEGPRGAIEGIRRE